MLALLKMCGFEGAEAASELPRIERAFNKLGITAGDIERGKQRLAKYYAIELKGIRKILRLLVLNTINSVLAREEGKSKIVYGFMIPGFSVFTSVLVSKSKEIHAAHLCPQFQIVLGTIFDKMSPVLEAAESKWLKSGTVAHCGNVKGLVGLLVQDLIPRPDLLITSGVLCDTAPKSVDLLHELYGIPACCYDTCQDREISEYPAATKRIVSMAAKSLRVVTQRIYDATGVEITDDMLQDILDARKGLDTGLSKLQELMETSDPLPISANNQILWEYMGALTFSIDRTPQAIDAVNTLCEDLQARASQGLGEVEKGAPRIVAMLPSHHTDPRQDYVVGELGMAIASTDRVFTTSEIATPEDPYERMIWHIMRGSLFHSTQKRIALVREGCKRLKADGLLDRYHVGCRTVTGDAFLIKEAVTRELDIPVLLQERDDFDARLYDHEQFKRSAEVFKTMLDKRVG
jgi:benzoyl-CoA reductase/2-hydroxyglutaryl-CoA dehydratase subunit BcrC/BadD/HgdB